MDTTQQTSDPSTLQQLQDTLGKTTDALFGPGTSPLGPLAHLKVKLDELMNSPQDSKQYAACLLLLLDACRRSGVKADQMMNEGFRALNQVPTRPRPERPAPAAPQRPVQQEGHAPRAPVSAPAPQQQAPAAEGGAQKRSLFRSTPDESESIVTPPADPAPAQRPAQSSLKLNWARLPCFRNSERPGGNPLFAVDGFLQGNLFEACKGHWAGYVQRGDKKVAVYDSGVLATLKESGLDVTVDGVAVQDWCVELGFVNLERLIALSAASTNPDIAAMATGYHSMMICNEKRSALSALFEPCEKLSDEQAAAGSWRKAQNYASESEFDVDRGLKRYVTWTETSHEDFAGSHAYMKLKAGVTPEDLKQKMRDLADFRPNFVADSEEKWSPAFNAATFEAKRGRTNSPR